MYLVFDCETTMRGRHTDHGRGSDPFIDRILCFGLKYQGKPPIAVWQDYPPEGWLDGVSVLVGWNIKFDLLFNWRNYELQNYLNNGGRIFCGQLAQYILSGQQHRYPALRSVAVDIYGRPYRDKNLEGRDTETCSQEELLEDVTNDVMDTEAVMKGQIKRAKETGMFNLIMSQMEGLLCTTEIEFNGMYINNEILERNKKELEIQQQLKTEELMSVVNKYWKESNL